MPESQGLPLSDGRTDVGVTVQVRKWPGGNPEPLLKFCSKGMAASQGSELPRVGGNQAETS